MKGIAFHTSRCHNIECLESGTVILIELCKMIRKSELLNYIGQNTIGFYFMSGALPIVLSMAVKHFLPESGFIGFAIVFAVSMVTAYFAVRLINRWLPWMLDVRRLRGKSGI